MDSAPLPRITGLKSGSDFEWHFKWQLLGKASYSACLLTMTMTRTDATLSVWHVTALIIRTPAHKSRITIPGLHSLGTERKHTRWHSKSFKSLTVSALFCSEKPSLHFHCSVWETKGLHIVLLHFFFALLFILKVRGATEIAAGWKGDGAVCALIFPLHIS